MNNAVGLKELRQNMDKYIKKIEKGDSLVIMRRNEPLFLMAPLDEEWEEAIDFTKIKKGGVDIDEVLSRL